MKIKSFFIQGNKIAKVKTSKSKEWKSSVLYDVEPKSSVEISIDIQWDKEGEKEITFFPLDYTSPNDRYNGGNLSTVRYFVLDDDININKDMLAKQSFQLETEINEVQNFETSNLEKNAYSNSCLAYYIFFNFCYTVFDNIFYTKSFMDNLYNNLLFPFLYKSSCFIHC
ncbi:hypothetical protein N1I87_09680 [Bacillus sp. FSL W8-0102]|uniref:hypothetical protein n=1 Tax=Bacillus sp. FSL W8-0102 TaxID=2978205 RepID=UPI0030FA83A6